jgi:hypothetical protein
MSVINTAWRRSTKCESSSCVEVADLGDAVGLRNSTLPEVTIALSGNAWREFVAGVHDGEFDLLRA